MDIQNLETNIVEKLKQSIPDLLVCGYPEKPQEFILTHPHGAILVHYAGANYGKPETLDLIVQDKKFEFSITVVTKNLRTHSGAYEILDKVKETLTGHKINGQTKLLPVKEGFLSENNGIWQYFVNFTTSSKSIEHFAEPQCPELQKVSFNEKLRLEE